MTNQPIEIPPPSPDDVLYEKDEGFAWVTLNRPVVRNAVNWSIRRRLMWALEQAMADDDVKAVVLRANGPSFCSGGDLQSTPPEDNLPVPDMMAVVMTLWQMPKPVIAAVNGHAVGLGCELAGICDLTIAAEDALFGEIQIRHGFGPPLLITPFLTGPKQAKELLMLGEIVSAVEAQRLGLVNRVVPRERLYDEAASMARKLAALSPKAVRLNKLLVNYVYERGGFRDALDYRSDRAFQELSESEAAMNAHLQVLREQGWEAFKQSRDLLYREEQQGTAG